MVNSVVLGVALRRGPKNSFVQHSLTGSKILTSDQANSKEGRPWLAKLRPEASIMAKAIAISFLLS